MDITISDIREVQSYTDICNNKIDAFDVAMKLHKNQPITKAETNLLFTNGACDIFAEALYKKYAKDGYTVEKLAAGSSYKYYHCWCRSRSGKLIDFRGIFDTYDDMLAEYKPFLKKPIGTDKRSTHIKHDTDICPVKSPWSDVGYPEVFALAKDIVDANDKYYTD